MLQNDSESTTRHTEQVTNMIITSSPMKRANSKLSVSMNNFTSGTTRTTAVLLSSPSDSSDDENTRKQTHISSASSFDRSDKFILADDFSSFESDGFVSETTASSDNESNKFQPLMELRSLIDRTGSTHSNVPVIILSDSSDDENCISLRPPNLTSSPLKKQPITTSLECLWVKIPLHSVKIPTTSNSPNSTNPSSNTNRARPLKGKRPLALSHFATIKKRAVNTSNESNTLQPPVFEQEMAPAALPRPSLSLKLRRSPTGHNWHASGSNIIQKQSLPVISDKNVTKRNNQKSPTKVSKQHRKLPPKSNASQQQHGFNYKPSLQQNNITTTTTSTTHFDLISSTNQSTDSEANNLAIVSSIYSNRDNDDDKVSVVSSSSLTNSTCSNGYIPSTQSSSNATNHHLHQSSKSKYAKRYRAPRQVSVKNVKSTICFEKIFSFYEPDLTLMKNELQPAHTLSLKNIGKVPFNHPIHSWKIGKSVPKSKSYK